MVTSIVLFNTMRAAWTYKVSFMTMGYETGAQLYILMSQHAAVYGFHLQLKVGVIIHTCKALCFTLVSHACMWPSHFDGTMMNMVEIHMQPWYMTVYLQVQTVSFNSGKGHCVYILAIKVRNFDLHYNYYLMITSLLVDFQSQNKPCCSHKLNSGFYTCASVCVCV